MKAGTKPLVLSEFALDLKSDRFRLDRNRVERSVSGERKTLSDGRCIRVKVELVRNRSDFLKLVEACPAAAAHDSRSPDEYSAVVLHKKDAQRIGIFHGTVLELKSAASGSSPPPSGASQSTAPTRVKHAVSLVFDGNDYDDVDYNDDDVTVRMSPVLWFNVCRIASDVTIDGSSEKQCFMSKALGKHETGNSASRTLSIPFANEVIISCVNSPDYCVTASYDRMLKAHFSTPRLLQEGDVFALDSSLDPCYFESIPDCSDTRHPVIYFKVKKILTSEKHWSSSFVDQNHSELLQESPVHSYVPLEMHSFFKKEFDLSFLSAFSETVNSMVSILQPFQNRKNCADIYPFLLLSGAQGSGLLHLTKLVASQLNLHHFKLNCSHLVSDSASATEARVNQYTQMVLSCCPCVLILDGIEIIGKDREGQNDSRVASYFVCALRKLIDQCQDWPVVVIATTSLANQIHPDVQQAFLYYISVETPDEEMRLKLLKNLLSSSLSEVVSLPRLTQRSAGMVLDDLRMMINYAKQSAYHRSAHSETGFMLKQEDFDAALDQMQSMHSEAIGAPKIPNVSWEDVGGLVNAKNDILDTIQLPLKYPHLLKLGLQRSGLLLYGPPGTGKTMLAKAVATECSLNFLSVKGPELLNMYVGQSEENVRQVFDRARSASPCVIFFDELDSLAPNRGRSGDSGGVMDRVVSQLLSELDGLHKSNSVFVIGATNRPDLVDPALLRPGRFDKLVYLGVCEDHESQLKILKALTRKFNLSSDCRLENIIERCPFSMTGADFYALSSDALLNAIKRQIDRLEHDSDGSSPEEEMEVSEEDFRFALDNLIPSISTNELHRYKLLQDHYAEKNKNPGIKP